MMERIRFEVGKAYRRFGLHGSIVSVVCTKTDGVTATFMDEEYLEDLACIDDYEEGFELDVQEPIVKTIEIEVDTERQVEVEVFEAWEYRGCKGYTRASLR